MILSNRLKLIPFNEQHYKAIFDNDNTKLGTLLNTTAPDSWTEFPAAQEALSALYDIFTSLANDLRWGSYFIILENESKLIGTCGFKGKPGNDNYVEIGYEINTAHQNKGYATEAAKALVDFAFSQSINLVKAHTLAEENASVHVLKKCRFQFVNEIIDPEDGLIWLWTLQNSQGWSGSP